MDEDFNLPDEFRNLAAGRGEGDSTSEDSDASDDEDDYHKGSITEILLADDQQIQEWKNFNNWDDPLPAKPDKMDIRYRFLKAARRGDVEVAEALMTIEAPKLSIATPQLIGCKDDDLYTALHRASYNGRIAMIEFLLQRGADISAKTDGGWEPLHCAANWCKAETVALLLASGANVNATTNGMQTPLHLASRKKDDKTMIALLSTRGIDINIVNDQGDTAFAVATRSNPHNKLFEIAESSLGLFDPPGPNFEPRIVKGTQ